MLSIKMIGGGGGAALPVGAATAYYENQVAEQRAAQAPPAAGDPARAMDEYMLAGVAAAGQPRWWSVQGQLAPDGAPIMPGELRQMLEGRGLGGAPLVQEAARNQRVGGWDLTFSTPKAVAVLWATASTELRTGIMDDMAMAARAGLAALQARGVFETRRGKGGAIRERASDVAAAMFPHVTSRAGDPQLHVHGVLINAGRRQDGTTGALDVPGLYAWKTYGGAMFRAELADRLAQRGVAITEDGQAFGIAGVPAELIKTWSKRRGAILDALDKVGASLEQGAVQEAAAATAPGVRHGPLRDSGQASDADARGKWLRELKERITQSTRQAKDTVPADGDLEPRWRREMAGLGLTPEGVWQAAREAARRHQSPAQSAADAALGEALERSAVVTERTLRRLIAEQAQTRGGGADGAEAEYDRLVVSGRLVSLQPNRRGEMVYSTAETLARERRMLLDAMDRRGEGGHIRSEAAEAAIAARPTLSAEQARAIRHTASGDGVAVVEGIAGSGKSFAMAAVVAAAKASGAQVIGLAPSWAAADVVRTETSLPGARALQGFVQDLDAGRIRFGPAPATNRDRHVQSLGERVVLLVDEAGMASSRDTAALLAHARAGGAQVILAGDRRQLRSVEPGAPFAALADALGVARMEDVRRQGVGWQREASRVFAGGDSVEGLARYDAHGRVRWAKDSEAAVKKVTDAWEKNRRRNPAASRLVLAARNADVHALNRAIRGRLLAAGELGAAAITVRTLHAGGRRGGQGEAREMELRTGDRLAIGVTLTRTGRDVLANDLATLERVTPGPDPLLSLRLDRTGGRATLHLSELAPPARKGQEPRPVLPVLQHAYARTIHKAQAQTVDFTVIHAGDGLDASRAYVALTRHRRDAVVVADAGAIAHRLAENGTRPTPDAVRQAFLRAARADADGQNAGDYVADRGAWLRTGDPQALPATASETRAQAIMRIAAETAARIGRKMRALRRIEIPGTIRDALVAQRARLQHQHAASGAGDAVRRGEAATPARPSHPYRASQQVSADSLPKAQIPNAPAPSQKPRRGPRMRM